jgi:hypothetical protein
LGITSQQPALATRGLRPPRSGSRPQRLAASVVGIAGTLLLHTLLVVPLFLDLSLAPHQLPNQSGAGASALASTEEPLMTVVFINEATPVVKRLTPLEPKDLASRGKESPDLPVVVLSPDPTPAVESDPQSEDAPDRSPAEAKGDQAEHALLYGRYLGQVQARIERAWMRPRSEIGAPQFSCRARISQDRRGDVVDVALDHCNGTPLWQQSLVSAIRTASPLPAPPDPSVYADRLWLNFQSEGFRPDGSSDGFEPQDRRTLVAAAQAPERGSLEHLVERFGGKLQSTDNKNTEVIHLTIIGSPNAAAPAAKPTTANPSPTVPLDPQPQ